MRSFGSDTRRRTAGPVARAIRIAVAGLGAIACAGAAMAADYVASLGPMPLDDETKAVIAGRGEVTATATGDSLVVQGGFRGLPSPATKVRLWESPRTGVPGRPALDLQLAGETSGTIRGALRLTGAQAAALRAGRLYIQVDSEKAPPGYGWGPKGTLWGWLLPAHATAGQGEPQAGPWFLPQLATPAR